MNDLQQQVEKLQAFKDFVHTTLDKASVNKHEEQNATTGCRVGARLADLIRAAAPAATPAPADAAGAGVLAHAQLERIKARHATIVSNGDNEPADNVIGLLLRHIAATPTPPAATAPATAAGEAGVSVLDVDQIELLRDNADFCNKRTRELLDRLLADYNRLLAAAPAAPAAAPAAPAAGPVGGFFLQGDPATNPFGPR